MIFWGVSLLVLAGMMSGPYVGPMVISAATHTPTRTFTPRRQATPTEMVVMPCPGDVNEDGVVQIDELIQAVRASLDGCP